MVTGRGKYDFLKTFSVPDVGGFIMTEIENMSEVLVLAMLQMSGAMAVLSYLQNNGNRSPPWRDKKKSMRGQEMTSAVLKIAIEMKGRSA